MQVSQWSFNARTHCQRGHLLAGENIRPFPSGKRECRLCRKWREQGLKAFDIRMMCPHGHRYTKANTYLAEDGQRRCRACRHRYYERSRCAASGCARKAVLAGVLCATHARLCVALDEEYAAYWQAAGYYA